MDKTPRITLGQILERLGKIYDKTNWLAGTSSIFGFAVGTAPPWWRRKELKRWVRDAAETFEQLDRTIVTLREDRDKAHQELRNLLADVRAQIDLNAKANPRFCKDCRFFLPAGACSHPDLSSFDLVTGRPKFPSADIPREERGECGPGGRLFQRKEDNE